MEGHARAPGRTDSGSRGGRRDHGRGGRGTGGARGPDWPAPPDDAVYHGPLGEIVRAVAPHTEADPVGVLGTLLASVGAAMGGLRFIYQGSAQAPNLFVVLVGDSSTGRKGTAGSIAREVMNRGYPDWSS